MGKLDWDAPRTEEGLQKVLHQLAECRASGDQVEIGNGLLALSFLVKWVRSDTELPPLPRSHQLALEALEVFHAIGDEMGEIRALVAASALSDQKETQKMLSRAKELADVTGDDYSIALVLITQARTLAFSDEERASELFKQTLEIYRRVNSLQGQAQCLFSLAITTGTSEEKRDHALEAVRLNRELGDLKEASRCMSIALMNAEEITPLVDLEDLVREGLQDALTAGYRSQEGHFYGKLALIEAARGHQEEAEKYRRWAADIQDADGLTPLERWENDVEMTKMMVAMSKAQGHKEAAKTFGEELKRLKKAKPKS